MERTTTMRKIPIIIGLLFGDEGKGTTVDFLCYESPVDYVLRFSGGPQTAHNVVTHDGKEHTFAQFGSGTFQGAGTVLSEYMLVNPFNMVLEADDLLAQTGADPFDKTYISENALLITPIHVAANRQREINRGAAAHGSCGEGIGETRAYALYQTPDAPIVVGDLKRLEILQGKLEVLVAFLEKDIPNFKYEMDAIAEILDGYKRLQEDRYINIVSDDFIIGLVADPNISFVFEGSQGVLLDEAFGFHPHTTWSNVTAGNALAIMEKAGLKRENAHVLGITRTYATRHGYGPFPSEFAKDYDWETIYPEKHNAWGRFQGSWRAGKLDIPLLQYAVEVNGVIDGIVLTHCDVTIDAVVTDWESHLVPSPVKDLVYQETLTQKANSFRHPQLMHLGIWNPLDKLIPLLEERLEAPVEILSYGPTAQDKKKR